MNKIEQSDLIPSRRQEYIFEILKERKAVSVAQLSKELYINEATIRRDLNALAKSGVVTRTYGGAVLNEGQDSEIPFFIRETSYSEAKKQIGETAADFIKDGDTVFLDSSSTTAFMIPHLYSRTGLKIVTNGAKAILMLSKLSDCELYCIGGKLRENSLSFVGESALQQLKNYHFDAAFFSCRGLDIETGLTDSNVSEAEIRKILIENSKRSFLLADQSKFDTVSFYSICPLQKLYAIITNTYPDAAWKESLKKSDVSLFV